MTKSTTKKAKRYTLSEAEYLEYQRTKFTLQTCDTSVMIADNDMNIIYVNDAVQAMLQAREDTLQSALPAFSVASLVGTNVDSFHKNPAHQRGMIEGLTESYSTDLEVSGLTFGLIASPLIDEHGERLGTIVEWKDKTDALALEHEAQILAAANARVKTALDACDTSVMIADPDLNIVYVNAAVQNMMDERDQALREVLPNFDSSKLIGQNVDAFHKDPSHQRGMLAALSDVYKTDITVGELTFGLIATPIYNDDKERLGTIVEWDDKTERLKQEAEDAALAAANARVKQALDSVTANVMIANPTNDIIYLNEAAQSMMDNASTDLREELPGFDETGILGSSIDIYHKNPAHQRNLLASITDTYTADMTVGRRTFRVIANPIIEEGERLGTVVEWEDRTDEVAIEREIDDMVEAASAGDFTRQIVLDGKDGFFFNLSNGLNRLVETTEVAMNDVIRVLGSMATGDLTQRVTRDYQGSFGQLKNDVNTTSDKLTEVISNIRKSSVAISTGANEIAQGNTDLSQRTEEQASSLEETASSMEEMTSTVKQSSENASHANELAQNAQVTASAGGEVVSNAVAAMGEISNSSKRIADIIGVINDIAFQTNLLALNAAVEAARAGEQGRGFAVVAGEVRNLAGRSADAAKEIKELIEDSVDKVNDGTRLVNDSGKTLQEIVEAVQKVSTMVQEISEAAIEQTAGIEQVNTAVTQMDEMTQQNAALVEEATAAGQAMAEQAQGMGQMMEFFTVGDQPTSMPVQTAAVPAPQPTYTPPAAANKPSGDEWEDF